MPESRCRRIGSPESNVLVPGGSHREALTLCLH